MNETATEPPIEHEVRRILAYAFCRKCGKNLETDKPDYIEEGYDVHICKDKTDPDVVEGVKWKAVQASHPNHLESESFDFHEPPEAGDAEEAEGIKYMENPNKW